MAGAWLQYGLAAAIAGVFGVGSAILTAKLSAAAERARYAREMRTHLETAKREFAAHYAEVVANNRAHATALRQQFARAYLHVAGTHARAAERYFIPEGAKLTIGRAPDCDIILDNDALSRNHALLDMDDNTLFITDLGSRNGIFVNDVRLQSYERFRLKENDKLYLGGVEIATVRLLTPSDDARTGVVRNS